MGPDTFDAIHAFKLYVEVGDGFPTEQVTMQCVLLLFSLGREWIALAANFVERKSEGVDAQHRDLE